MYSTGTLSVVHVVLFITMLMFRYKQMELGLFMYAIIALAITFMFYTGKSRITVDKSWEVLIFKSNDGYTEDPLSLAKKIVKNVGKRNQITFGSY